MLGKRKLPSALSGEWGIHSHLEVTTDEESAGHFGRFVCLNVLKKGGILVGRLQEAEAKSQSGDGVLLEWKKRRWK